LLKTPIFEIEIKGEVTVEKMTKKNSLPLDFDIMEDFFGVSRENS